MSGEIQARVFKALRTIAPEAELDTLAPDADLRDALDLDSMDFMNFVIGLSQATGRKIPDADTPRLQTLRSLVAYLGG